MVFLMTFITTRQKCNNMNTFFHNSWMKLNQVYQSQMYVADWVSVLFHVPECAGIYALLLGHYLQNLYKEVVWISKHYGKPGKPGRVSLLSPQFKAILLCQRDCGGALHEKSPFYTPQHQAFCQLHQWGPAQLEHHSQSKILLATPAVPEHSMKTLCPNVFNLIF